MAKKSKVPRPPRPVQAPQRRAGTTRSRGGSLPWAWITGAAVAAALVIGVAVAVGGGGSSSSISDAAVAKTMRAAGCTFSSVPPKPPKVNPLNYHQDVPTLSTPTKGLWSTFPPSGGGHYPYWAVWGFYRQPVNPRQVVHNEEHGGVIIWWGPGVPSSTVDQLQAFYQQQPVAVFGTPIAGLGKKIALTAWSDPLHAYYRVVKGERDYGLGHIAICSQFNQKAFATFRSAYRGEGPENPYIPIAADQPGCGPESTSGCE